MKFIRYKEGYKYQLAEDYVGETGIASVGGCISHFVRLEPAGQLAIRADYAWDGPSGPTIDTANFMRGSLEHDALYQLMREGLLPPGYRQAADLRLRDVCLEDGMSSLRAWWVYRGVRFGGAAAIEPDPNAILTAP